MADKANPEQTENEQVEEQTPAPSSGDENQDPQTQDDGSQSEEEVAPSEEEEKTDDSEPTGEEESGDESSEEEGKQTKSRKGRGLQTRLKQVLNENAQLKSEKQAPEPQAGQTAQPQQPAQQGNLQAQALDAVNQIDAYQQQYGELPEQISPEDYVHLQRMAAGQVTVQQDTQQAMASSGLAREVQQLRQEFAAEKAKAQAAERTNEVLTAVREAEDENPILREGSNEYDGEFADTVLDDLKEALDTDADRVAAGLKPNLDVKKFIEKRVKVYRLAQSKGGESASAELAKQAAGSAVPPSGGIKRGEKSPEEMSPEELAAKVGADWDLKK